MTMRTGFAPVKDKKQLKSILLVYMLVATSMVVIFPLTAPKAEAVVHLASAMDEDGNPAYDFDGIPFPNGYVLWDQNDDHIISDPAGYIIQPGYTLDIPPLNYDGNPMTNSINIGLGLRINVDGTLLTHSDSNPVTRTAFISGGIGGWDGIYFHPGSRGCIEDVLVESAINGVVFEPGSELIFPGIRSSTFRSTGVTAIKMDGAGGYTNIVQPLGDNTFINASSGIGLEVSNGFLNISNDVYFENHGPGLSSLHIVNATVSASPAQFVDQDVPGNAIFIEGEGSNDTVINLCSFQNGEPGYHFIRVDGSSPLISDCNFQGVAPSGPLTIIANDDGIGPGHPILRNPNPPGTFFDNATLDATGSSSVTLQWYLDINVTDPNGNPIGNAPVWVVDRLSNPAQPPSKTTGSSPPDLGWARGFICTELILYENTRDNFNPFNISAENNTIFGYAIPEESISMSMSNTIVVPFNPTPNTLPVVSYIAVVPPGPQSGLINIEFMLHDPDPGENGSLSIVVEWSTDLADWNPALPDPITSDPTFGLDNNATYTFVWVSNDISQFYDQYTTTMYIRITPYDTYGPGTPSITPPFTVDNKAPNFLTGPVVTLTNTTALIEWTVDETAEASVWYGLTLTSPVLTTEVIGNTGMSQSVQLTGLQPGRNYTFVINSTDPEGNKRSSIEYSHLPPNQYFTFETEIHIQLKKGWNMISIPPYLLDTSLEATLASIAGQYDAVQAYYPLDPTGDYWKHYRPGKPFGNDLLWADQVYGLWIHMKNDAVLIPGHKDPTLEPLFSGSPVGLEPGWNFVGYPSMQTRLIDDVLKDAFGNPLTYDIVQTYDAITGQWLSYDGSSGSLKQMEMGRGYWIHVPAFTVWQVDYI
jgi:hypothetical protein